MNWPAEICNLQLSIHSNQQILWLDISVYYMLLVQVEQRICHLTNILQNNNHYTIHHFSLLYLPLQPQVQRIAFVYAGFCTIHLQQQIPESNRPSWHHKSIHTSVECWDVSNDSESQFLFATASPRGSLAIHSCTISLVQQCNLISFLLPYRHCQTFLFPVVYLNQSPLETSVVLFC